MIAHLPMYDVPRNRAAHLTLWNAFRDHYSNAPETFGDCDDLLADWLSPSLILSQTCGLPFCAKLHGHVQLVATPCNNIDGCPEGFYNSVIVARTGSSPDLATNDFTLAYNEPLSQSGWAAPQSIGITGRRRVVSGGHANSAQMVVDGRADIASIDALTWHFLQRDWDGARDLVVLTTTPPTPTLPYITSRTNNVTQIRAALAQAILEIGPEHRETLQIFGLTDISAARYLAEPIPTAP